MIGIYNDNGAGVGAAMAKVSWVYILAPFLGGTFAALVYMLHRYIDNIPAK